MNRNEYDIDKEYDYNEYPEQYEIEYNQEGEIVEQEENPYLYVDKISEVHGYIKEYCQKGAIPICEYLRNEDLFALLDY